MSDETNTDKPSDSNGCLGVFVFALALIAIIGFCSGQIRIEFGVKVTTPTAAQGQ